MTITFIFIITHISYTLSLCMIDICLQAKRKRLDEFQVDESVIVGIGVSHTEDKIVIAEKCAG